MRWLSLAVVLAGCGGGNPFVGTWQFDLNVTIETPNGPEMKTITTKLKLVPGAKTATAWSVGSCLVDLDSNADMAILPTTPKTCTLATGDYVFVVSDTGAGGGFNDGDVLTPTNATLALFTGLKPSTANHTWANGEQGLSVKLGFEIGAMGAPSSTTVNFDSNMKNYGYRVQ